MGLLAALLGAGAVWFWVVPPRPRGTPGAVTGRGTRRRRTPSCASPPPARPAEAGLILELAAGLLAAGQPVPAVLAHLGAVVPGCEELARVSRALDLALPWDRAWEGTNERFAPLARALGFAHGSGAAASQLIRREAAEQRRAATREAETRAARLAVRLVVPLGVCALPAFICLGIVPLVVSLVPDL